jgi:hypothetical protein
MIFLDLYFWETGKILMRLNKIYWLLVLLIPLLAACGGETAEIDTPSIEGPALVMFYTDN